MSKPANYYASAVAIPDYVENDIKALAKSYHELLEFASSLIDMVRYKGYVYWNVSLLLSTESVDWLQAQSVDTFKSLHKWLSNELI